MSDAADDWSDWTDEALLAYEERLYDEKIEGADTWELRDQVLWEINRRGLWEKKG